MVKKEMKIKMKLEQIIENRQENVESTTFIFKPTLDELHKAVTFKVTAADPFETMGNLGLPQGISDTVIVSFTQKEEQQKLDEK